MLYGALYTFILYLLALCVLFIKDVKRFHTSQKTIYFFICAAFLNEALQTLSAAIFHTNTILYNFATVIEFSILLFFFIKIFNTRSSNWVLFLVFVFFIIFYLAELYVNDSEKLYSISFLIRNVSVIFLSLFAFQKLVREIEYENITDNYLFWVCCGTFLYYSGTLFVFGLKNMVNKNSPLTNVLVYIHFLLNFLMYGLFAKGLLKVSKKTST
jgi:hypothetical protein